MDFKTIGKDKLPQGLVFPVSAAVLQEKLGHVPHEAEVSVNYFYSKPITERLRQKTKFGKSNRGSGNRHPEIIDASLRRRAVSLNTPSSWQQDESSMNEYTRDQWELNVRPVALSDLPIVRKQLEEEGYRKLAAWLVETSKFAGSIGVHNLFIEFDGKQLTYRQFDRL